MKVEFRTDVEITLEEAQVIEKARDILCDYETNSDSEQDTALVDKFEEMMGYSNMDYSALPIAIDFLTFLLRVSGYEEEN